MWKAIIVVIISIIIIILLLWPAGINKDFSVSVLFIKYTFFYRFSSQLSIHFLHSHLLFLSVLYHQATETLRPCVSVIKGVRSVGRDESVTHGWRWSACSQPISSDKPTSGDRVGSITCSVALSCGMRQINVWSRVSKQTSSGQYRPVYFWFHGQMEGSMMVVLFSLYVFLCWSIQRSPFTVPYFRTWAGLMQLLSH